MASTDVEKKVKEITAKILKKDASQIRSEMRFVEDLGADSLDTVELVMEFEDEFDINIPDEDAEKIQTVGNAVEYITSKS